MPFRLSCLFALCLIVLALPAKAQDAPQPAVLVADRLFVDGRDRLVAEGNVEALYGENRVKARRIIYDRAADSLVMEGPITLIGTDGTVILADQAELDRALENGLLRGARMMFNQQVQLAAHQIDRVGGRYTQLYKVAATSCQICGENTTPIWQIRAQKVVHDQEEKQLYFTNAQLRFWDVPVFWFPRVRLPDPSLSRASGFLIPSLRQSSKLGLGLKLPYFIKMGDHRDLTLTPFLSPNTRTLEWRYRQEFRNGGIAFSGAITQDDLAAGTRGYIEGSGLFNLPRDFKLSFGIEAVTDKAYVDDYSYSLKDRLESNIAINRVRRDQYIGAELVTFQTLRANEDNSTMPTIVGDLLYERRSFPARIGGELRFAIGAHSHYRYSNVDVLGRDIARADAEISWRRSMTLPAGIRTTFDTGVAIDAFTVHQDSTSKASDTQMVPYATVTLRWPWMKAASSGAVHIVEPVAMLGWVGGTNTNIANDESTRVEFDEGNLLSLSRFPGPDRRERGRFAAYGLNWSRHASTGWASNLTIGQIVRETADPDFSVSSGLTGLRSDILIAGQLRTSGGLNLTARSLFDTGFDLTKAEARATWQRKDLALGASYVWLGPDTMENRLGTVSEWSLDGLYRMSRHWTGSANWRYDVASDRTAEAGIGLQYRNECLEVNLSLSRRFTSSSIVDPSTDFGFTVGLLGFSAKTADQSYTRTCRN